MRIEKCEMTIKFLPVTGYWLLATDYWILRGGTVLAYSKIARSIPAMGT